MSSPGLEYLFCRLHGLWEQAFQGARLERLLNAASEDNFLALLKAEGLPLSEGEDFSLAILRRLHNLRQEIQRQVSPELSLYLSSVLDEDTVTSLKLLLRRKFLHTFPQDSLPPLSLDGKFCSPAELKALQAAADAKEFVSRLPSIFPADALCRIAENLADSQDLLAADSALDGLASQRRLQAASKLPLSCRKVALELVQREIDLKNTLTVLRNLEFHHFPPETLAQCWLPGGVRLTANKFAELGALTDRAAFLAALPASLRDTLTPFRNADPSLCESALWNDLQRKTLLHFRDFGAPELSIVSFPYLMRFEAQNLLRIREGLRLGLSAAEIRKMLIL